MRLQLLSYLTTIYNRYIRRYERFHVHVCATLARLDIIGKIQNFEILTVAGLFSAGTITHSRIALKSKK